MSNVKDSIEDILTSIVSKGETELQELSSEDIAFEWYWYWEEDKSIEWNTYKFSDILELHKRRWRRWEEEHNGFCCVVERVRDKYVMPRVKEFLAALAAHTTIAKEEHND